MENRCSFWLAKKKRYCANFRFKDSVFCGNHNTRSDEEWVPCPIDPSHTVLSANLEGHMRRCPLLKQAQSLSSQPFYQKGINGGKDDEDEVDVKGAIAPALASLENTTSVMKRNAVHSMTATEFYKLIHKIQSIHSSIRDGIRDSYKIPEACDVWMKKEVDGKLPFQEKHVVQQASILGNLEEIGILKNSNSHSLVEQCDPKGFSGDCNGVPAVVEFGAGRGYLTQMLADCYGIKKVFLVERKSYKLKADRTLRQKESLILERLRIDIEDLNLKAVEALQRVPYLAIGKHLCGPATDLSLRCCLPAQAGQDDTAESSGPDLRGLALATCCHHLCQWKHYINKKYFKNLGLTREDFHAITWFTSWAVDADHGTDLSDVCGRMLHPQSLEKSECVEDVGGVAEIVRNMEATERAVLGFMCKEIIDMGRLMWVKENGLETQLVKYVPPNVSPENHLLIAGHASQPVRCQVPSSHPASKA